MSAWAPDFKQLFVLVPLLPTPVPRVSLTHPAPSFEALVLIRFDPEISSRSEEQLF